MALWLAGAQVHELFVTIGAWATFGLAALRWRSLPGRWALVRPLWPLVPLLLWGGLVPLLAGHPGTGSGLARLFDAALIFGALVAGASLRAGSLRWVALAAGAVLALSCLAAALQYFGAWPRSETFSALWWAQVPTDRVYEPVPGRDDRFMAGGLLLHRLRFANVSSVIILLLGFAALRGTAHRRLAGGVALAGLVSVAVFPHARAATVALVAALLVMSVLGAPRRGVGLAIGLAVVGLTFALVLAVPSFRERFASAFEASGTGERASMWAAAGRALATAPLTGLGPGRYQPGPWLADDAPEALKDHRGKAHNQLLTIAVELGVPGALLFLALLVTLGASSLRSLPDGAGALAMVSLTLGLSVLHDPLFHAESSMALFGGLGLSLGLARRQTEVP